MARFAACFTLALSCTEAMSVTKHFSHQLSNDTYFRPKNFLVLRLAHTGSSWLTAMLEAQNQTYVTREAIYPMHSPKEVEHVKSLGKEGILSYIDRAFKEPSGNIHHSDRLQIGPETCSEVQNAKAEVRASLLDRREVGGMATGSGTFLKPRTCKCLHDLGTACPLKFLGMTLDPTSQGVKDNLDEIFSAIQKRHPDMPVLVYRRSNIVKHSLATGGLAENKDGGQYSVALHQELPVGTFMQNVAAALTDDAVLRKAASYFPNAKTISYEHLVNEPKLVMENIFKFIRMPGVFEDWMAEMGDKHSPDDLRLLIKNFDEVEHALETASPCLAKQLRAAGNERFSHPCEDEYSRLHAA